MTDTLQQPLTPTDCNLRDFGFMPLDVKRLLTSETWILGTGDERAAAITLWLESWHQVPAASLPDDDRMLAHLSQSKAWKKVKAHALRGWIKCADGRFYHPVVAEKALEAWIEKLLASLSGAAGNAKRWGVEVDTAAISARVVEGADLLKLVAPQSKTLRKKQVAAIVSGSRPDQKNIAPRPQKSSPPDSPPDSGGESPPESSGDRNRQGQGHRDSKEPPIPPYGGLGNRDEKSKGRPTIALKTFLEACRASNEKPIPENDPVFDYAETAGIPLDLLRLHWLEFKARYSEQGAKRYRDWRAVYRKSVRGNWLRLWYMTADGACALTTVGEQAKRTHMAREAA